MIDIDRFGEKAYSVLGFSEGKREMRKVLDFELPEEIKKKYASNLGKIDSPIPLFEDMQREKQRVEEEKRKKEAKKARELEWQEMLKELDKKVDELPGGVKDGN